MALKPATSQAAPRATRLSLLPQLSERQRRVLPYLAAVLLVGWAVAAAEGLYQLTDTPRVSMVFLAAVLIAAFLFGSWPAYVAAGLSFVIYNFYLSEPRFSFSFRPEDLLTLVVFFAVAMLTGNLTGRVRDEATRAKARARTTAALFDATRDFSAAAEEDFIRSRLAHHLAAAAKGRAIVRGAGSEVEIPAGQGFPPDDILAQAAAAGEQARVTSTTYDGWTLRPLHGNGDHLGTAAWRPLGAGRLSPDEQALLEIMTDAGAAAIARARLAHGLSIAEARARTEDLRNALLSSISHDLRTPLASILGSASTLQQFFETLDPPTRNDLLDNIQEEAERLNAFVANLLSMTKLESGALAAERVPFALREVVERLVRRRTAREKRPVTVSCRVTGLEAIGDAVLFEQALGNVLENALRYTPPGSAVRLKCERRGGEVAVSVEDDGPGVSPAELALLFVKFYRAASSEKMPGTGLGLSITKGLIEAMGGAVSARNRGGRRSGLIVTITLPAAP